MMNDFIAVIIFLGLLIMGSLIMIWFVFRETERLGRGQNERKRK